MQSVGGALTHSLTTTTVKPPHTQTHAFSAPEKMVAVRASPSSSPAAEWICCLDKRWVNPRQHIRVSSIQQAVVIFLCFLSFIRVSVNARSRLSPRVQFSPDPYSYLHNAHISVCVYENNHHRGIVKPDAYITQQHTPNPVSVKSLLLCPRLKRRWWL